MAAVRAGDDRGNWYLRYSLSLRDVEDAPAAQADQPELAGGRALLPQAKRFFQKPLRSVGQPTPRVINVYKHPRYPPVVLELKKQGFLRRGCRLRPVLYLNNILEQYHRAAAGPSSHQATREGQLGFPILLGSPANDSGLLAVNLIRKGQVRRVGKGEVAQQLASSGTALRTDRMMGS